MKIILNKLTEDKAVDNLEFANFLVEEHDYAIKEKLPKKKFYDWCITVYYYSLYHGATALLDKLGYSSKSHAATIVAITLFYYHKDNVLNKEDIELLIEKMDVNKDDIDLILDAKSLRERACYGVNESFDLLLVNSIKDKVVNFSNKIRVFLEK